MLGDLATLNEQIDETAAATAEDGPTDAEIMHNMAGKSAVVLMAKRVAAHIMKPSLSSHPPSLTIRSARCAGGKLQTLSLTLC